MDDKISHESRGKNMNVRFRIQCVIKIWLKRKPTDNAIENGKMSKRFIWNWSFAQNY